MKITISHYQFSISSPYLEGHSLTSSEARALNNLRAENIRNNVARLVPQRAEILSTEELFNIQAKISEYDSSYSFSPSQRKEKVSILDLELAEVAREYFPLDWEKAKGFASVQIEARRRLEERKILAERGLKELLGEELE